MTPQSDFMTLQWVYHSVKNPGSGHSLESTVLEEDAPLDPEVLGHGPWPLRLVLFVKDPHCCYCYYTSKNVQKCTEGQVL